MNDSAKMECQSGTLTPITWDSSTYPEKNTVECNTVELRTMPNTSKIQHEILLHCAGMLFVLRLSKGVCPAKIMQYARKSSGDLAPPL